MNITSYVLVVFASQTTPTEQISISGPEEKPPTWSVGAGVGLGQLAPAHYVVNHQMQYVPTITPRLSFERIMSPRWALGLGAVGYYQSSSSGISGRSGGIGIAAGPRWTVSPHESPVDVSLYVAGTLSYSQSQLWTSSELLSKSQSYTVGLAGGLVLERKFLERFALRLNTQLISAAMSYSQGQFIQFAGLGGLGGAGSQGPLNPEATASSNISTGLTVVPSPSLEFRVYF